MLSKVDRNVEMVMYVDIQGKMFYGDDDCESNNEQLMWKCLLNILQQKRLGQTLRLGKTPGSLLEGRIQ